MRKIPVAAIASCLVLGVSVALLYGPYANNPIFFDDTSFFADPQRYVGSWTLSKLLGPRWVATETLAVTLSFWGASDIVPYHVGSLLLHILTVVSAFIFIRELLAAQQVDKPELPAYGAALLFAVHPVAAFAAGYIIERSILLAGLFSIWMWLAVHRGVTHERAPWLLASALFYYLAVFSKEHAVTALPVAVLIAWNAADGDWRRTLRVLRVPGTLWVLIAITIVLRMKGYIGSAYEPILGEMMPDRVDPHTLEFYLRSVVNQGWLFFKYVLLWIVPYEGWMAIDLREPFPPTWFAWPWIAGAIAFLAYPAAVAYAHGRGLLSRLTGIALVAPWLLFLPMFGAVVYQENFVLYRSYLWALPATLLPALLLARLPRRSQVATILVLGLLLFGLTWGRLQTFSHPVLIWDEAVSRIEGHDDLPGAYRVYHGRGLAYFGIGDLNRAIADYDKAIALNPTYAFAIGDRGFAYYGLGQYERAISEFDHAITLRPDYMRFFAGRGSTLLKMGRRDAGLGEFAYACSKGYACTRYHEELDKANSVKSSGG